MQLHSFKQFSPYLFNGHIRSEQLSPVQPFKHLHFPSMLEHLASFLQVQFFKQSIPYVPAGQGSKH